MTGASLRRSVEVSRDTHRQDQQASRTDTTTSGNATSAPNRHVGGTANTDQGDAVTHPTTNRADQRIADLALIAATPHQPNCDAPTVALDLLIDHVGPAKAARYLTEAHTVLLAEQES